MIKLVMLLIISNLFLLGFYLSKRAECEEEKKKARFWYDRYQTSTNPVGLQKTEDKTTYDIL